jgi:TonB family protein
METRIASAFAIAALLTTSCARPPKQQAVGSPAGLKEAIEKAAPAKEYAIYASGQPARAEDLSGTVLFACGCADSDIDEKIAAAFVGGLYVQIFPSSEVSTISGSNVSCPGSDACMTANENLVLSAGDAREGRLQRTSRFYDRSTPRSALIGKCLERARAAGRSVIVVPRDSPIRSGDGLVELVFKQAAGSTSGVVIGLGTLETLAEVMRDINAPAGSRAAAARDITEVGSTFRQQSLTIRLFDGEEVKAEATAEQMKLPFQGRRIAKLKKTSAGTWTVESLEQPPGGAPNQGRPEGSPMGRPGVVPYAQKPEATAHSLRNPPAWLVLFRLPSKDADGLLVRKVGPIYPPLARQARIEGTVVVDLSVSEEGTVSFAKLVHGHPLLVPAAMEAARKWIYKPYIESGKPKAFVTTVNIPFSLN